MTPSQRRRERQRAIAAAEVAEAARFKAAVRDREVIVLRAGYGMPYWQIAQRLGVSEGRAGQLCRRICGPALQ